MYGMEGGFATGGEGRAMQWTDGDVETLKALWSKGRSAREIGEKLGVTRNAVIGKANRMGLAHNSAAGGRRKPAAKPVRDPRPSSPLDLTERMCRWPLGHPGEAGFHFCGVRRAAGRPYCEAHCRVAYRGRATSEAA